MTQVEIAVRHHLSTARMLLDRLERLSADSRWAHRASGLRGSLLQSIKRLEISRWEDLPAAEQEQLEGLLLLGSKILENAAREIGFRSEGAQ